MSFWLRTKNIKHSIRAKKPIVWVELDDKQLLIYIVIWIVAFSIFFFANITIIWKVINIFFLFILAKELAKKHDNSSINNISTEYWRTQFEWFKLFIRKKLSNNKSVDKGSNYNYFIKK